MKVSSGNEREMPFRLDGKVALVTGGSRGIGAACVKALANAGASVALCGTRVGAEDGDRFAFSVDLSSPSGPHEAVGKVLERFGRIDILINNAGIFDMTEFSEVTPELWDHMHALNLRAPFFLAQQAAEAMKAEGGAIVNMSSIAGQMGGAVGNPAYPSSKAGLIGLTKALARRLGAWNIRVNCIAPADIETDMTADWPEDLRARLVTATPLSRFGTVDEVSQAAVFLCAPAASYITGQVIAINGGAFMA